ncbi:MAG: hypothetical protein KAT32_04965 [Candidatus Moranbacteria bacterium]|nr:hypothetical protein [Candidatus Moranbacteria bacterium]
MNISKFPKNIFWNYEKNINLPDEVVVNRVFLYGDMIDMYRLSQEVDTKLLRAVLQKIKQTNRYKKRVNFISKVILSEK